MKHPEYEINVLDLPDVDFIQAFIENIEELSEIEYYDVRNGKAKGYYNKEEILEIVKSITSNIEKQFEVLESDVKYSICVKKGEYGIYRDNPNYSEEIQEYDKYKKAKIVRDTKIEIENLLQQQLNITERIKQVQAQADYWEKELQKEDL